MTKFDIDLVGHWFDLLLDLDSPADSSWDVHLNASELEALAVGGRAISAAVGWSELPSQLPTPADHAAAVLQVYLSGMATGIAGARATMAQNGDLDEVAVADRLCLAAGLIAGGAAVQIAPDDLPGHGSSAAGAADLARAAGTVAAELVVDGADLHAITSAAAAAALAAGPPDAANRDPRYRARAVVALVLVALQRSTAPAGTPVLPPSCGAVAGGNNGAALLAEVTFTTFLPREECDRLQARMTGLAEEVVLWSEGDKRYFHVHTEVAGEVIAEAYAVGAVFSLVVGRLD